MQGLQVVTCRNFKYFVRNTSNHKSTNDKLPGTPYDHVFSVIWKIQSFGGPGIHSFLFRSVIPKSYAARTKHAHTHTQRAHTDKCTWVESRAVVETSHGMMEVFVSNPCRRSRYTNHWSMHWWGKEWGCYELSAVRWKGSLWSLLVILPWWPKKSRNLLRSSELLDAICIHIPGISSLCTIFINIHQYVVSLYSLFFHFQYFHELFIFYPLVI